MTRFGAVTAKSMNIIFWDKTPCSLVETSYMQTCFRRLSSISKSGFISSDVIQHSFSTILISDRQSRQWWAEHQSFKRSLCPHHQRCLTRASTLTADTEQLSVNLVLRPSVTRLTACEQFSEISSKRMLQILFPVFNYALPVFMVWYFPIDKFVELVKRLGYMNWLSVQRPLFCEVKLTRKLRIRWAGWLPFTSRCGSSV